jgi:hypothetical protein
VIDSTDGIKKAKSLKDKKEGRIIQKNGYGLTQQPGEAGRENH